MTRLCFEGCAAPTILKIDLSIPATLCSYLTLPFPFIHMFFFLRMSSTWLNSGLRAARLNDCTDELLEVWWCSQWMDMFDYLTYELCCHHNMFPFPPSFLLLVLFMPLSLRSSQVKIWKWGHTCLNTIVHLKGSSSLKRFTVQLYYLR